MPNDVLFSLNLNKFTHINDIITHIMWLHRLNTVILKLNQTFWIK